MIVLIYLAAIVAANLSVAHFGPSSTIVVAFLFIGLDLASRDTLHDRWKGQSLWARMGLLILAGSLLSYGLNRDAGPIALASCIAFLLSGVADSLMYHLLRERVYLLRANGSNLIGAGVDSLVFPTLAFGSLIPSIVLGQFVAKVLGGFLWSYLLQSRKPVAEVARA